MARHCSALAGAIASTAQGLGSVAYALVRALHPLARHCSALAGAIASTALQRLAAIASTALPPPLAALHRSWPRLWQRPGTR